MAVSMSQICYPVFVPMLRNLRALLAKGAEHCSSAEIADDVMVRSRLYPNMLPLSKQVQIACDTAKRAIARLSGVEAPVNDDTETSLEELMARIDATLEFIQSVPGEAVDGSEDKPVTLELPGQTLNFTGITYLTGFALPNFLFHVTTAHGILRSCGVPIGKRDFLAGA